MGYPRTIEKTIECLRLLYGTDKHLVTLGRIGLAKNHYIMAGKDKEKPQYFCLDLNSRRYEHIPPLKEKLAAMH